MLHLILEYDGGESWLVGNFDFIEYSDGEMTCWVKDEEKGAYIWATLTKGLTNKVETRLVDRLNPDAGSPERPYFSDRASILPVE